jgi:hypothetical protein
MTLRCPISLRQDRSATVADVPIDVTEPAIRDAVNGTEHARYEAPCQVRSLTFRELQRRELMQKLMRSTRA